MGGILRDNLGEGHCESRISARQWGVNFCREAFRGLAGRSGMCFRLPEKGVEFKEVAVMTALAILAVL